MDVASGQYSLGFLLVVVTAVCVGLGLGLPAYVAAARVEPDPLLVWGAAMVLFITGGSFLVFKWFNQ